MNTNKFSLALIFALVMMVGYAFAVPSCTVTDSFSNTNNCITGATNTVTISCSATTSLLSNITNATLIYNNAVVSTNGTFNLTSYTFAFDSTSYSDTSSGSLRVSYNINGTTPINSSAVSVEVDNTASSNIAIVKLYDSAKKSSFQEITCTGTDSADSSLSYVQLLRKPDAINTSTSTSTSVTYAKGDILMVDSADGYRAYCTVTNNCGLVNSSFSAFSVLDGEAKTATKQKQAVAKASSNSLLYAGGFVFICVILIVVIALVLDSKKKAKKRRRR